MKKGRLRVGFVFILCAALLGLVLIAGSKVSHETGIKRIYAIAAQNDIPMDPQALYGEPTKGENSAGLYLSQLSRDSSKEFPGTSLSSWDEKKAEDWFRTHDKDVVVSAEIADSDGYKPKIIKPVDGDLDSDNVKQAGQFGQALGTLMISARLSAEIGRLSVSIEDFQRGARIVNFFSEAGSTSDAIRDYLFASREIVWIVASAPAFKGHPVEMQQLHDVLSSIKPVNVGRLITGEATHAAYLATHSVGDAYGVSDSRPKILDVPMDVLHGLFGPPLMQAYADDLREIRKNPTDLHSPAVLMPHVNRLPDNLVNSFEFVRTPPYRKIIRALMTREARSQLALIAMDATGVPDVSQTHDPLGSGPYKVVVTKDGWKVYSVGEDGVDDGGYVPTGKVKDEPGDIVVSSAGGSLLMQGK